jgi:hypothetical protein
MAAMWAYWIGEFLRFRDTNRKVQQLLDSGDEKETKKARKNLDMWV